MEYNLFYKICDEIEEKAKNKDENYFFENLVSKYYIFLPNGNYKGLLITLNGGIEIKTSHNSSGIITFGESVSRFEEPLKKETVEYLESIFSKEKEKENKKQLKKESRKNGRNKKHI